MFDFAWSELALIGVVAMVLIGPKDMPVAIKAVKEVIRKARAMAAEFQTHVDEMVRDVDLKEVRDSFNEIRNFDIKGEIEKAVDADGKIRDSLNNDLVQPLKDVAAMTTGPLTDGAAMEAEIAAAETPPAEPAPPPAFIPPQIATPPERPAFIPPGAWPPDIRT